MKEFYGANTGKNCSICGRALKTGFYNSKPLCYTCWKNELRGRNNIKDIMARTGENSTAGRKTWKDNLKQNLALKKNYNNEYVDYFGNRKIDKEKQFICNCGNKDFFKEVDGFTCKVCRKFYKNYLGVKK